MTSPTLIEKVYDTFEHIDFTPYTDNLNPIREISPYEYEIPFDDDDIYQKIKNRVNEIKEDIKPILSEKEPDLQLSLPINGEHISTDVPQSLLDAIERAGGSLPTGDTPFGLDPLVLEINLLIAMLPTFPPPDQGPTNNTSPGPVDGDISLFVPDCTGLDGDGNVSSGENGIGDDSENTGDLNAAIANLINEASGNSPADNASGDAVSYDEATEMLSNLLNEQDYAAAEEQLEMEMEAAACAAKELAILKIILIILKVIRMLKEIITYVLMLILPIIDMIQLAAGAWLNPTNIGKIIQRIVQRLMALVISLIAMILAKIWEMLNLDCLIEAVQDIINQINEVMSGISAVFGELRLDSVKLGFEELLKKIMEPLKDAWKMIQELKNIDIKKEALNALGDVKDIGKKLQAQYLNPEAAGSMLGDALPPGAAQAIKTAKDAARTAQRAIDMFTAVKSPSQQALGKLISPEVY